MLKLVWIVLPYLGCFSRFNSAFLSKHAMNTHSLILINRKHILLVAAMFNACSTCVCGGVCGVNLG